MEFKDLVALFRHWIWLLILGMALGLAGGYTASRIQTPIYEATAKILVTRTRQQGSADLLSISDQQLVLTYQQLLRTRPVLDKTSSRLGIKVTSENVNADIIPDTQIIQIRVQDADARHAAEIANALVHVLIEENETLQAGRYTAYEEGLNSQIVEVQGQISALQSQIAEINEANIKAQLDLVHRQITNLQNEIASLEQDIADFPSILSTVDRVSLTEKQTQLDQIRPLLALYQEIQTNLTFIGEPIQGVTGHNDPRTTNLQLTLNLYQQLYLNLLNNLETVKLTRVLSTPTVSQIEEAAVPERPVRPIPLLYTALAGMAGLFVASGAILIINYFDDTLKSAQKIQELLGVPVIGQVGEANHKRKTNGSLHLFNQASSSLSNAFESLKVNLSRLIAQKKSKTLLVTSPGIGEGKTTISANLAAAFVRSGSRVILLDADLNHPQIHFLLGLENQAGLTNILAGNQDWHEVVQDFSGMTVITSGPCHPASAVLLESDRTTQFLKSLQKEADVVIIDGPPLFIVDAQILVAKVGGILLVIRQGNTLTSVARAMLDQLRLMDANVLGVVMNRVPRTATYYFDGYYRNIGKETLEEKVEKIEAG